MSSKLASHWHIKICHVSFGPQDKDKFPIQNLWVIIFIKIKINFIFKIGRQLSLLNKLNRDNYLSLLIIIFIKIDK